MSKQNYEERVKKSIYANLVSETGKFLYNLREGEKLSQTELIAQLSSQYKKNVFVGISKTQYGRIETGKCFMNTELLIALCYFYKVSADDILFGPKIHDNSMTIFLTENDIIVLRDLLTRTGLLNKLKS